MTIPSIKYRLVAEICEVSGSVKLVIGEALVKGEESSLSSITPIAYCLPPDTEIVSDTIDIRGLLLCRDNLIRSVLKHMAVALDRLYQSHNQ